MASKKNSAILMMYASTEQDPDMLYRSGLFIPDPFLVFETNQGNTIAVVNQLEYGRVKRESKFKDVWPLETIIKEIRKTKNIKKPELFDVADYCLHLLEASSIKIPSHFQAELAFQLQSAGYRMEIVSGTFYPQREKKQNHEIRAIRYANRASAAAIRKAEEVLQHSTIHKNTLVYDGKQLTSERLRAMIDKTCLDYGCIPSNTIVAGGKQACDPHCQGSGPLRPNEFIIIDVFPRDTRTGYYGDLTRTFLKGKASALQKKLISTVQAAQKRAIDALAAGVSGQAIHNKVANFFIQTGYKNERSSFGPEGFIHGTGHGVGLALHEAPRVSPSGPKLKENAVLTVEPGLYYPDIGGCRIEDVLRVKKGGAEKLSQLHYRWLIP